MQSPQAKVKQISRILALWPSQAADDGEELLRAYLFVVDDYPADDVERAVDLMVKGIAPGINPGFRPKPSEVGAECRRQMNLRVDHENRLRAARPKLPPPDIVHSPESRERVKAMVAGVVAKLSANSLRGESEANRIAMIRRANERFDAERGYGVGDPEDHEAAA